MFLIFYKTKADLAAITILLLYLTVLLHIQIGGLNTAHLFLKIFHVLLVDVVVLVTWELVDPLQSETIKISEEVRK